MINKKMMKYLFLSLFLSLNFTACQSGKEENNTPPKGLAESTATKKNEKNDNWEEDIEIVKPELDEKQKKGIMLNVVRQYCQSVSEKDYKKLESLFADSIEQFNHLKATQKEKVTVYVRNFYQQKKNIKLMADYGAIEIEKNTIQIPIKFIWEKHQEEKLVKMGFDEAFNMISYEELPYQKKEKNKLKQWAGKYVLEGGRQEEAFLEIKALKNNKFSFELKLNENGDCKGSLEGNAIIISDNQASTIEIENCKILFRLESDGQIKVEEAGECNRHSITCSFDGYYTKK